VRNVERSFHALELLRIRSVGCVGVIRGEMEFIIKTLLRYVTKDYGALVVIIPLITTDQARFSVKGNLNDRLFWLK
jgi:hypothetical protein